MGTVILIAIGVVAIFFVMIALGKAKGAPSPESMPVEAILTRMRSEENWISRYKSLPFENQQGEGIKKQFESKKLYVLELKLELMKRNLAAGGTDESQTLIPVFRRIIELMKSGLSEEDAKAQAAKEMEESQSSE